VKDNTLLLMTAEVVLAVLGGIGLCTGQEQLAYTAVGACGALLAGHLNGTQKGGSPGEKE
jgi:hypothetical protein